MIYDRFRTPEEIAQDREEVTARLTQGDRTDFIASLARLLECEPTVEELRRFAAKAPDRFYQAMAIVARLSGMAEEVHVRVDGTIQGLVGRLPGMSDAEVRVALQKELKALDGTHDASAA